MFKTKYLQFLKLCLFASMATILLSSCAGLNRDLGLDHPSDVEQREGITGTQDNPYFLDPFKCYHLVMAASECRYFAMKVPSQWYWKLFLTAANREDARRGTLRAQISKSLPPWASLPNASLNKDFDLGREGESAVLGLGNNGPTRMAILRLCQDGAPLRITLQSEVSSNNALISPDVNAQATPEGN